MAKSQETFGKKEKEKNRMKQQQEVPSAQLASLIKLIAHACKKYDLPYETITTHRDNSTQTTCPGKNLYKYFENGYVKAEVKKLIN